MPDLAISKETLDEAIDRAGEKFGTIVSSATDKIEAIVTNLCNRADAILASTSRDAKALIDSLDGWTATITVTLHKPKEK